MNKTNIQNYYRIKKDEGKELEIITLLSISLFIIILLAIFFDYKVVILLPFISLPLWWVVKSRKANVENRNLKKVAYKHLKPFLEDQKGKSIESTLKRVLQAIDLSYNLIPSATQRPIHKNESVQKVIDVIQKSLSPVAIRISLTDSDATMSARCYLVGYPKVLSTEEISPQEQVYVKSTHLKFGGKVFGSLDLEFSDLKKVPKDFELQFGLVASYCSILLMNDEFSKELLRLKRLSEETLKTKTGFLATLSHEIRGPLGVILNSAELISDGLCGEVNQMQKDTLKMVKKSSTHLLDLVNDVLDYARIESGSVEAKPVSNSLRDILSDIAAIVRSQAIKKHQKLIVERCDDRLGVICDKRHLRQILINILTNAIKYTPEGGTITLGSEYEGTASVRIYVKDTGVGIPPDQFSKVFAPFQRIDDEYSNKQVGTGLGMALTKKLIEANNGFIDFESVVGQGSMFWIELEACKIEKIATEEHDGTEIKVGKGESLLLLEPDNEQRLLFSKSLEQRGFKITSVSSAADAISSCRANFYSAMIVETDLPDFDAQELIQSIRSVPSGKKLPIVVMSGKAFLFDIEHYLKLGVDRCLSKPFTLAELSATVRRILDEVVHIEVGSSPHYS